MVASVPKKILLYEIFKVIAGTYTDIKRIKEPMNTLLKLEAFSFFLLFLPLFLRKIKKSKIITERHV